MRIVSPTNPADSIQPVLVTSARPVFKWVKYPSSHEYIVEVFNSKGTSIWGGYLNNGRARHTFIDASHDSIQFNFDASASVLLKHGQSYRWKVYADGQSEVDSLQLISAREDLLGLFRVDTTQTR